MSFDSREATSQRSSGEAELRLPVLGRAPELRGVHPWFNTAGGVPLTLEKLRGHVVLVEFWTFACPNCRRTLPFLREMHKRYQPDLTVVGVHTPEHPFERRVKNVESAVLDFGLEFPVGLDNDYVTWDAYANRYWPSQYLIDRAGELRYTHIGERSYDRTEAAILALLSTEG